MKSIRVYIPLSDFNDHIKSKLSENTLAEFEDCTWVPLELKFNLETDMSIEAFVVPVKNGEVELERRKL